MIYEAILYQGMTIDLNTQRKRPRVNTHATSDTNDHTHKSDSMSLHFQAAFMLTYPIYLLLFNKHQDS